MSLPDVGVIGLGAIGGSLALELTAAGVQVRGYDIDARNVAAAGADGIEAELWRGQRIVCDVVVIAVPVRAIAGVIAALAQRNDYALITDTGSTKRNVIRSAMAAQIGGCFVGSHPLAGTHLSGWFAARRGLFAGKITFLCATPQSSDGALRVAESLWSAAGAITRQVTPEQHDAQLAWTSHLPQLTANALALTLKSAGVRWSQLGSGGGDMTRLAGSSPQLWLDVAMANADMLDEPLGCLIEALSDIRNHVVSGNETRLAELLRASQAWSEE